MDPNAALASIRTLAADLLAACWAEEHAPMSDELAGHILDLDDWLSKGGFLPDAWATTTGASAHSTESPNP